MSETKICKTCGVEKSIDLFPIRRLKKYDYVEPHCLVCAHIITKTQKQNRVKNRIHLTDEEKSSACSQVKICVICRKEMSISEFGWGNKKLGYKSPYCRKCSNTKSANNYNKNKEKWMFRAARSRAKKAGVPFNIDVEDIVIPDTCPALGVKLNRFDNKRTYSPSLDRVNPEKGYVKGNVCVISTRANQIKNDAKISELEKIIQYIKEQERKQYDDYCI